MTKERTKCKYEGCDCHIVLKDTGYCHVHSVKMGLVSDKKRSDRIRETMLKKHKRLAEEAKNVPVQASIFYSNTIEFKNFNLKEWLDDKLKNGGKIDDDNMCMDLIVDWWFSNPDTRIPPDINHMARIFSRPKFIISDWIKSKKFQDKLKQMSANIDSWVFPYVQRVRNILCLGANKDALLDFFKRVDNKVENESTPLDDVADDMLNEAKEISKIKERKSGKLRFSKDENDVIDGFTD